MTPRILIIDCEPESRERVREQLLADGFEVRTATDGESAIRLVEEWDPQLAVLDVRLGAESGLDLLRHLLELRRSLTTILVSAYPGYRDDFTAWLADAFLNKSPDLEELKSKIHELLPTAPAA
jgi:DNA-binding response OmpR family regulator